MVGLRGAVREEVVPINLVCELCVRAGARMYVHSRTRKRNKKGFGS